MKDNILISNNATVLLNETVKRIDGAYAPMTIRAYKTDFANFIEYCRGLGELALPSAALTVARYIEVLSKHYSSAFIRRKLVAISSIHRLNYFLDPTKDPIVNLAMTTVPSLQKAPTPVIARSEATWQSRCLHSTKPLATCLIYLLVRRASCR